MVNEQDDYDNKRMESFFRGFMILLVVLIVGIISVLFYTDAFASKYGNTTNNYYPTQGASGASTDVFNTYPAYGVDKCAGAAIAAAGANNQMYGGTSKPQLSLGVGECDGELASSLMFGQRLNKNLMLNGSWAQDEDADAFGIGIGVIFK